MNEHITDEAREAWEEIAPRVQWVDADGEVIDEGLCVDNDAARVEARQWCEVDQARLPGSRFRAIGLHGSPVWTFHRRDDGTIGET